MAAAWAERCHNGETADALHDTRCAGKSVTKLLAGIAIDRGLIHSIDDPVSRYWPEAAPGAISLTSENTGICEAIFATENGIAASWLDSMAEKVPRLK